MVAEVRRGRSMRSVAKTFRMSLHTVQRWVTRAADGPLDEVDWADRPSGDRTSSRRTKRSVEQRVLTIRRALKTKSDLGEYGAAAIRRELLARNQRAVPSLRTIGRILERGGLWMDADGCDTRRHRGAGSCRTSASSAPNWTALT
jgi:transposase